jgi:anti-anti-sigma factor
MSNLEPPTFALRSTPADAVLLVKVVGEVDMITAPQLSRAIESAPDGTTSVVIDLSEVTFLDSSGLNALVQARRLLSDRGLGLQVVVPPEGTIRRVFEITHLTEQLTVIDRRPAGMS